MKIEFLLEAHMLPLEEIEENRRTYSFVLALVGAKHKSDFQVHLDIQNLMLVLISNLHKINKIFVHFTNTAIELRIETSTK